MDGMDALSIRWTQIFNLSSPPGLSQFLSLKRIFFADNWLCAGGFTQRCDGDRSGGGAPGLPGPRLRQTADGRGGDQRQGRQVHRRHRKLSDRRHTLLRKARLYGKTSIYLLYVLPPTGNGNPFPDPGSIDYIKKILAQIKIWDLPDSLVYQPLW